MQAIGNYRLKEGDRVIYTTFEQFMNRYINHIRQILWIDLENTTVIAIYCL